MILLSASKVWLWVQRDGGIWSFLTWTRSHLSLHRHPEVSLEEVEVETLLTLQEKLFDLLLELGVPVSRWMFSVPDFLHQIWFVHLRLEKWIFHILWEIFLLLHWVFEHGFWRVQVFQLLKVCYRNVSPFQYVKVCESVRHPSNIPSARTERIRGTIQVRLSFQTWWILDWSLRSYRVILNQWAKRNDWSFKWFSKKSFVSGFLIRQEILNVSQKGKTFQRICPPIFIQTWLPTIQQTYRLFFCVLLSQQSHLFLIWCGVDVQWFQERFFTGLAKFQGIVSVNDFRLPIRLQELLQAPFVFPEKFLFCTDTTGSIGWPSPAPRLHIDDCFEIHNLPWQLCDLL